MKPILVAIALVFATPLAAAEDPGFAPLDAASVKLSDFLWQKRPVVVFADTPADPAFAEQMQLLESRWPELSERDVVVITDTDPAAETEVRQKLRPRGFALVLVGKDGTVALRKPFPWDVRELTRAIDKMPMRREEMRAKRSGN
jgi:hypothetical protein